MVGHVANKATAHLKQSGAAEEGTGMRKAARVGKAGVVAVVEVFDAMHDSGRKVLSSGSTETATCVQYRCVCIVCVVILTRRAGASTCGTASAYHHPTKHQQEV